MHEIFGTSSDDSSSKNDENEAENEKGTIQLKRKFWREWVDKFQWLTHYEKDNKIFMKCEYCMKYKRL